MNVRKGGKKQLFVFFLIIIIFLNTHTLFFLFNTLFFFDCLFARRAKTPRVKLQLLASITSLLSGNQRVFAEDMDAHDGLILRDFSAPALFPTLK